MGGVFLFGCIRISVECMGYFYLDVFAHPKYLCGVYAKLFDKHTIQGRHAAGSDNIPPLDRPGVDTGPSYQRDEKKEYLNAEV